MLISHDKLRKINEIQISILKEVSDVCKKLDLKFFMVHGSLLGTVRSNSFVPDDDDIDIAFLREDYEKFVNLAPKYLNEKYFVQTYLTDKNYPMEFAKIRDCSTTYIIDVARNLDINHGIYIDIFPIDNSSENPKYDNYLHKLMDLRISNVFYIENDSSKKKMMRTISKIVFPSLTRTLYLREKLNKKYQSNGFFKMTGGKPSEKRLKAEWFSDFKESVFEGVDVYIPCGYKEYLTMIYGDFENRTLIENKISNDEQIEVNACYIDTEKSYLENKKS